jgi:murein DD-endopeptidase MepM/ murein hydrolase activator NlpD
MKLKLLLSASLFSLALTACTQEPAPVADYTKEKFDLSVAAQQMRDGANRVTSSTSGNYNASSTNNSNVKTAVVDVVESNDDFLPAPIPAEPVAVEGDFVQQNKITDDVNENDRGSVRLIEVLPGQTLKSLAEENKVPIRSIIDANNLTPPYELYTGQKLFLPHGEFHEVKTGENLFSISREYGVDVTSLARLNGISGRDVKVGEKLQIPHRNMEESSFETTEKQITGQLSVSEEDIAPVAVIGSEELGPPAAADEEDVETITIDDEPKPVVSLKKAEPKTETKKEETKPAVKKEEPKQDNVKVTFKDDGKFSWPVKGTVVKKFSTKNDGINIAVAEGTNVRATRPGEVVYAGNELKGYGNLVLLKHSDGYLTAYAHMKEIKVKKGDKLGKGSILGEVGKTGKVKSPQLFFAIRKGKSASDPLKFLK